ncbi:hypothetical protein C8034_v011515 [Colletotrichum sidae]|uniref:Uncharacterized protein n=1 Tax=Colletotrichum sidae TaxID=1347389 RepID=A0A4R8TJ86_9PEZI|nr:hypothetical protein C8034_v011515 [Colletotrichum sidae]
MAPKEAEDITSREEGVEPGSKRKVGDSNDLDEDQAADEPDTKKPRTASTTVEWLLSAEAFSLAFPALPQGHGEVDWDPNTRHQKPPPPEGAGKKAAEKTDATDTDDEPAAEEPLLAYPDSALTPFQNLVAALLLSKPISHRLGLRTINTLLNPPFRLRTPQDLDEAGFEGRRKVMWEARTQHKEKTATQLGGLVEGVRRICGGDDCAEGEEIEQMEGLRDKIKSCETPEEAQKKVESILKEGIKGVGPTGAGIFLRRVQGLWEEVFPYADERALDAAVSFELIEDGAGAKDLADKVSRDRGQFVKLLDVLVGIQLEKKMDEALEKAGVTK